MWALWTKPALLHPASDSKRCNDRVYPQHIHSLNVGDLAAPIETCRARIHRNQIAHHSAQKEPARVTRRRLNDNHLPRWNQRRHEIRKRVRGAGLEHDPEKWIPVFRKDHAQSKP
jgi:hypothetical protein